MSPEEDLKYKKLLEKVSNGLSGEQFMQLLTLKRAAKRKLDIVYSRGLENFKKGHSLSRDSYAGYSIGDAEKTSYESTIADHHLWHRYKKYLSLRGLNADILRDWRVVVTRIAQCEEEIEFWKTAYTNRVAVSSPLEFDEKYGELDF